MRAFEVAARRLSFSLAAEDLHVTQGAISRQVRLLEDFLGHPLFVRQPRGVVLTKEGTDFCLAAEKSLDLLADATRRIRKQDRRSTLKVSITQTLAVAYLLPRLPEFLALRPDIEVRVLTSTAPADFESDEFDIAIRLGALPGKRYLPSQPRIPHELVRNWRNVVAFPLWDEVLTPVLNPRLLASGKPVRVEMDLCQFTLLSLAPRPTAWADWFSSRSARLPGKVTTTEFGHFFMALDAARAGRGVALVPTLFLGGPGADSGLVCPFTSTVPSAGEYYFLCKEGVADDEAVRAFRAWLMKDQEAHGRNPAR
ncbi:MAG: LysR substrate-binding domain-containing protein [Xenophilus sp.]